MEADWKRYFGAADAIEKAPLYINRMPGLSVMQIRGMARRMKAKRGLSLVSHLVQKHKNNCSRCSQMLGENMPVAYSRGRRSGGYAN